MGRGSAPGRKSVWAEKPWSPRTGRLGWVVRRGDRRVLRGRRRRKTGAVGGKRHPWGIAREKRIVSELAVMVRRPRLGRRGRGQRRGGGWGVLSPRVVAVFPKTPMPKKPMKSGGQRRGRRTAGRAAAAMRPDREEIGSGVGGQGVVSREGEGGRGGTQRQGGRANVG